jgi:hypothetical protein
MFDTEECSPNWCPDDAISMEWIEQKLGECIENHVDVDSVYMSNDVYVAFLKKLL